MCTGRRWGEPLHAPARLLAPVSPCCCQTLTHASSTQVQRLRLASRWQSPVDTCTALAWQVEQSNHLFITCTSAKTRERGSCFLAINSVFPIQQLEVLHRPVDLQILGASSSSWEIPENCYDKTFFLSSKHKETGKCQEYCICGLLISPLFSFPFSLLSIAQA